MVGMNNTTAFLLRAKQRPQLEELGPGRLRGERGLAAKCEKLFQIFGDGYFRLYLRPFYCRQPRTSVFTMYICLGRNDKIGFSASQIMRPLLPRPAN
jgi:hypothetical protein